MPPKDRPLSSEWILLAIFLIFGGSLAVIAKVNVARVKESIAEIPLEPVEFLVTIEGAVKKPGSYSIREGTPLSAVLRKAGVRPDANLRALDPNAVVQGPLRFRVEPLQEIRVWVEGAVLEPLELMLPVGSRICNLRSKISCTEEADLRFFRRRKMLKDGDKIWVPKKTVE